MHSKAIDTDHTSEANERPLTIGGRVPVKVSSINGDIKAGDSITSSDIPGVGMKATKAGRVVGIALEDYSNSDTNHVEKILLFVNSSWYDPDVLLATDGNLTITPTADSSFKVQNADKDVNRIGAFATLIVGKIRAGVINAQQISVNSIVIATDNVTIGGQRLSDYIDSIVDQKLAQNSQSVTSNAGLNYLNNLSTIDTAKSITLSEINADRIIVGLEINTPKAVVHQVSLDEISSASGSGILVNGDVIFTGTITADKIRANQIEGLEILTNKISSLDSKIATIGANLIPAPVSTESSLLEKQSALIDKITKDLASASASATVPSGSLTSGVLDSSGLTIINGGIRVKGNGLFEGILTVLDTLTTNNFIVNGASTFFSDVLFKGKVNFDKNPTFASDTGGFAAITKGTDRVEVKFDTEFENDPFINAQVSFDEQKDAKGNVIDTADLEQAFFSQGYKYIILNRSKTGFTIVLNKKAGDKVNFTWTAIQVKDAKTIQSRLPD